MRKISLLVVWRLSMLVTGLALCLGGTAFYGLGIEHAWRSLGELGLLMLVSSFMFLCLADPRK